MNDTSEMGPGAMVFTPSFIETGSGIYMSKLLGLIQTH
jgi:hypothetical protein